MEAEIALLAGVSGHADQRGLLNWVKAFETKPRKVFLNHGEDASCEALGQKIGEELGLSAEAPYSGSVFDLLSGEWIRIAEPVPQEKNREKKKAGAGGKKASSAGEAWQELYLAVQKLMEHVQNLEGHANSELRELTRKIRNLY